MAKAEIPLGRKKNRDRFRPNTRMRTLIALGLAAILSFGTANVATAGAPATTSSYSGIIGMGGEPGDQGKITITISPTNRYTLRGKIAGIGFSNKGDVENGAVSDDFVIKLLGGFIKIPCHLEFVVSPDGKKIDGLATFVVQGDSVTLPFTLYRSAKYTKASPAPQAGRHVLVLNSDQSGPVPGRGVATVRVSPTGSVVVSGLLADGAKISCGGKLSEDGLFPILNVLYKQTGFVAGFAQFGTNTDDSLQWAKFTKQGAPIFEGGLTIDIHPYVPPAGGSPAIDFGNAENTAPLGLSGGGLPEGFPLFTVQVTDKNKVIVSGENEEGLQLKLNKKTGLISGTIKLEIGDTTARRAIRLVILQESGTAQGLFVSPELSPNADLGVL